MKYVAKILSLLTVLVVPCLAANYTIKPSGGNYTTIQACASAMAAGDTCTVYAGTYNENVTIPAGTVGNYKTITVNGSDVVNVYSFTLNSHTKVIGNCTKPAAVGSCGFSMTRPSQNGACVTNATDGATDMYVTDNTISQCGLGNDVEFNMQGTSGVSYLYIQGNTFSYGCGTSSAPNNCVAIELSGNHILIENNDFSHFGIVVAPYGQYEVVRNNTFHDIYESECGSASGNCHMDMIYLERSNTASSYVGQHQLWEGNTATTVVGVDGKGLWTAADNPSGCGTSCFQVIGRYNAFAHFGSGVASHTSGFLNVKWYNNSWIDPNNGALASPASTSYRDDTSTGGGEINNLYYYPHAVQSSWDWSPYALNSSADATGFTAGANMAYCSASPCTFSGSGGSSTPFPNDTVGVFTPNILASSDPLTNYSGANYHLASGSPAIAAGTYLTTVASADTGTGTSLIVNDAGFFQDGLGLNAAGVQADCIAVNAASNHVCVTAVNYSTNTLTLASSISRSSGQGVYLYSKSDGTQVLTGSAPDIGAYPFTANVGPWYISNSGSDSNNCNTISTPCQTFGHLMPLTSAGDTINILNMIRLSTSLSNTAGNIVAKNNQIFTGPACTPTSVQCTGGLSGSVQFTSGQINGPDGDGNYYVTGQTQQGIATQPTSDCDTGYTGCIYPEDLFVNGTPYQHLNLTSEATLSAGTWWFNYSTHTVYLPSTLTPTFVGSNTVETSVLETAFNRTGPWPNNVTVENLTIEEFAAPLLSAAVEPYYTTVTNASGLNWMIKNNYITLNHGSGVSCAFGEQVINNVLTANGNFGTGGGCLTTNSIIPSGLVVQGNTVTYNNYAHVSPGFGAGGMKWGNTANAIVRGNIVENNLGNGIHFDENSINPLIDGNTLLGNVDSVATGGSGAGIICEIGEMGCMIRNNTVNFVGINGTSAIASSTTNGAQIYCNEVTEGVGITNPLLSVVATDRGNNTNPPNQGAQIVSTQNQFHHNTLIWDTGTGHVGYFQNDTTNQPNFFADNTPPDYNTYHLPSTSDAYFVYDNNNTGSNTTKTFANYQSSGADIHGTVDTVYTSDYPTVSITSPADQASVANPVTINSTASDGSGIASVKFYVDWVLVSTVTSGPYNYSWAGSGGTHTVAAMAVANSGVQYCNAVTLTQAIPGAPTAPSPPTGLTGSID